MSDKIERRDFIKLSLAAAGGAVGLSEAEAFGRNSQTLPLEQLDLGKVRVEPGPTPPAESFRRDGGLRLPPGSSLWVDLKGGAESFTATIEPEKGSGTTRVKFRVSNGAEFRDVVFRPPDLAPRTLTLPLAGHETLIVETEAVESQGAFTALLSNAAITYKGAKPEAFVAAPLSWSTAQWRVEIDGKSGAVTNLANPRGPHAMNWIRPTGRWGNGLVRLGDTGDAWLRPATLKQTGRRSLELTYRTRSLGVKVRRWIDAQNFLREAYTFTNTTGQRLKLDEGAVGILTPLNDRYPGADVCLTQCCNAHIWPGGHTAYVNALRMGGAAPHLGLVLTEGAINDYSIDQRPQTSDDRGWFVLHPSAATLAPQESRTVTWALFWHEGHEDFFAKAKGAAPDFVRLEADEYTLLPGEPLRFGASASAVQLRRAKLAASLERYEAFVLRELQDESGVVYNDVRRQPSHRLYNYPWVAHLHLALYHAMKERERLQRFVRTLRALYRNGGERYYTIGLSIIDGLKALEEAGMKTEREELLTLFRRHADRLLQTGTNYPKHEVNYEQSIVAPAVQILLEVYLVTKEASYLEGARKQLVCLEAFNGRQPDYRLHDIAVRHWDDYWFGKRRLYGDTQPHYWSTLTAVAFQRYAEATGDESYARRARTILRNNLIYFSADGRASCAYVNPLTVNGQPGRFFDPWANDQDWALVNWLSLHPPKPLSA